MEGIKSIRVKRIGVEVVVKIVIEIGIVIAREIIMAIADNNTDKQTLYLSLLSHLLPYEFLPY